MIPRSPIRPLAALALACLLAGCGGDRRAATRAPASDTTGHAAAAAAADSVRRADSLAAAERARPPGYARFAITGPRAIADLRERVGEAGWQWTLRVNRVDSAHVRRGDTLVVPERFDSLALAPFPPAFEAVRDSGRLILVSRRVQAFAAYDSGRLARWGPVSTGRRDKPTPAGLYHTNWKDEHRLSTFDSTWVLRWYLNLDNFQGVSLHQFELPGRPASHSCVRLLEADAIWLYGWARTWNLAPDRRTVLAHGTPVVVFGDWRYGARAPWKRLPEDPLATRIADDELADALRILRERVAPDYAGAAPGGEGLTPPDAARPATTPAPKRPAAGPPLESPAPPHMFDSLRPPPRADTLSDR